jgi:hypothetical protein
MLILVPTPSAPDTNTGFSYPDGISIIPLNPPILGANALIYSTKDLPLIMSTPEVL